MEKPKTKLGARILSKSELNAILPNAESVYEQIDMFRSSIPDDNDKQQEPEQKTNNIGIMGRRGTGKTSILKTFYEDLKNKNEEKNKNKKDKKNKGGDIILPIIVPENMSSGTALMDVVLGMLKPVVEERKESNDTWSGDCIYSGRNSLEKKYNELVKQYCYIKKDYRDILIQQFTTEQNYVDKTKEVFNSDSEFINLFNQFVKSLLQNDEEPDKNSMMFLFIDDIDLSTNRCMDVVRTLLSYLSNPRIVTFISGDIKTFEESLTLEFLRQEKALSEHVFKETYYSANKKNNNSNNNSSLLERKKNLAYEYLKKIIPPAYRRTIKCWSLEERGNYQIIEDEKSKSKTLVELLIEISKEKLGNTYFAYKEDDEQKYMNLAFHMFDDTSRGLNNVYNTLQELYHLKTSTENMAEDKKKYQEMLSVWRLIETMVDSNPLYAKYKVPLLEQIVVLEQEQVKVNFENAYQLLYGEDSEKYDSRERFAIFFFIDFSARLFSQEQQDNDDYIKLKNKIISEYLNDETVDDRIASNEDLIDLENEQKKKAANNNSIRSILLDFLRQGDFIFILHLIRYLGSSEIYNILKDNKINCSEKKLYYKIAFAFASAVKAINETKASRQEYLAHLYLQMPTTMLQLLSQLSLNPWMIYGGQLTDGATIIVNGKQYMVGYNNLADASYDNVEAYISYKTGTALSWAEYENKNSIYWIYYENNLREKREERISFNITNMSQDSTSAGLTKTIMNQMKGVIEKYSIKELQEVNYNAILKDNEKKVIAQIDKKGLWNTPYAKEKVFSYIEKERKSHIFKMSRSSAIFDATELLTGAYSMLKNCDKGSSGTALAYDLLYKVQTVIFLSKNWKQHEDQKFSDGKYYLRLEQALIIQCLLEDFLWFHGRAKYGKKEARQLLMEIKELPLVIHTPEWNNIHKELKDREELLFMPFESKLTEQLKEKLKNVESWDTLIENARKKKYEIKNGVIPIEGILREYSNDINKEDTMCFRYLVQKKQIQKRIKELNAANESTITWNNMEPLISTEEYMFIFHSYFRYLQATDSEAEKAGIRAEAIAMLAEDLLDSEIIADEQIQNEVYEAINEELGLTEEEFETLF